MSNVKGKNRLHLDQYYTPPELAEYCIAKTYEVLGADNIKSVIEPSAGTGVFSNRIENCVAYDLEPKSDGIIKADYLNLNLGYECGRLVIGNPPFGVRGNLMKQFCNKSFDIADFVSFILPINQLNNTVSIYKFDLVHSEDLGLGEYSGKLVHCCLNVYKRPKVLNKKPNYKEACKGIVEIYEVIQSKDPKRNRTIGDFKFDFGVCAWGYSIGKTCSVGEYAKSFFFKIEDELNFQYYKELILNADWGSIYKMQGVPNLLQWQVYKYVSENILESEDEQTK